MEGEGDSGVSPDDVSASESRQHFLNNSSNISHFEEGINRSVDYGVNRLSDNRLNEFGDNRLGEFGVNRLNDYGLNRNVDFGGNRIGDFGVNRNADFGINRNMDYGINRSVNYGADNLFREQNNLMGDVGNNFPDRVLSRPPVNYGWQAENNFNNSFRDGPGYNLPPYSNTNCDTSERKMFMEPIGAECEPAQVSVSRSFSREFAMNKPGGDSMLNDGPPDYADANIGPSEDREDISDEELDSESWPPGKLQTDNACSAQTDNPSQTPETAVLPADMKEETPFENNTQQATVSDNKNIVDLKIEDTTSHPASHDGNQQSKESIEDLETVSDDELAEVALAGDHPADPAYKIIQGGEQVSSSEDECPDSTYATPHQDLPQVDKFNKCVSEDGDLPIGNMGSSSLCFQGDDVSGSEPPASLPIPLAPMEAEPISDEEDLGHSDAVIEVEGGEAGEIQSPPRASSPSFPEQTPAGLLGEVEPISADESSDTDGELPSGDEDISKPENSGLNSNSNFLESIDSDEEGDLGSDLSHKVTSNRPLHPIVSGSFLQQNNGNFMDTVSDEVGRLQVGRNVVKLSSESSLKANDESHSGTSPFNKDIEADKRQTSAAFNEHHEELDYEENEGEDGEGKSEVAVKPHEKKEIKEAKEHGETGGSDKDEGECSDDDCEEGEIKEPGNKKPFIKPMCRFFQRGNCTWGINCRFLHPGINDKGNYQMIEIPGFKPVGIRARLGAPGTWPEQPEEPIDLPPPPIPDVPPVETAWERGLRIAKEQRKKASERKEQESDFAEKCLNLSVDEEKEVNKENEQRMPKIIPKDPYYDQHGVEEDNYYYNARNPWQTGHYENFEVRYNRDNSFSPPYREKPQMLPPPVPPPPPARFNHPYTSSVDKFVPDRIDRREPFRPEPPPVTHEYPASLKRPDEWTDPWRRSKSPQNQKRKVRSRSRGRRTRRSVSDSSNSSRSSSGSSSGSSRSSRTFNSSTGSSSRSRSREPVPPNIERHDRYISPSREQLRSAVSVRGSSGYNNYDQGHRRMGRGHEQNYGGYNYNPRAGFRGGGGNNFYNNYGGTGGGPPGGYPDRELRDRNRDDRPVGRIRARSPPDRPLPYVRPRPKSVSSRSSSSRSRSRSRGRATSSRSRSSSGSSRSSSSSSSSDGSADSEHLYRDLGSPSKNPRGPNLPKRKRTNSHKDHPPAKSPQQPNQQGPQRRQIPASQMPINLDHIPHPRDPKPPLPVPSSGRPESKYASRNAPQAPVKAKDPLKVVGQKSNIKLTLLPKQQQSSLGSRPNPLDSPPHTKRRLSDHDMSPVLNPPAKRLNIPMPPTVALRQAIEKAAKIQVRQDKGKSPPSVSLPQSLPPSMSSGAPRTRSAVSPQKAPISTKSRTTEQAVAKTVVKAPPVITQAPPPAPAAGTKAKKSMSSRREELLKQLKAVEDAIARKKSKIQ